MTAVSKMTKNELIEHNRQLAQALESSQQQQTVMLSARIPKTLAHRIKTAAVTSDTTVQEMVQTAMSRYLDDQEHPPLF